MCPQQRWCRQECSALLNSDISELSGKRPKPQRTSTLWHCHKECLPGIAAGNPALKTIDRGFVQCSGKETYCTASNETKHLQAAVALHVTWCMLESLEFKDFATSRLLLLAALAAMVRCQFYSSFSRVFSIAMNSGIKVDNLSLQMQICSDCSVPTNELCPSFPFRAFWWMYLQICALLITLTMIGSDSFFFRP